MPPGCSPCAGVLLLLAAVACWLTNALALPGNWMIVGLAGLFAWLLPPGDTGRGFGWPTVAGLAGIATVGELLEFAAGAAGAAKHGSSRRAMLLAMVGAMVGSIAGAVVGIPVPVVGPLIAAVGGGAAGAFGGAYLGETLERQNPRRTGCRQPRGAVGPAVWHGG